MNTTDPNRTQSSDYALLIQLLDRMNTSLDGIKGSQLSSNSTLSLLIEQLISMRGELKTRERETLETRAFRSDIEIQALEAKDREYAVEVQKLKDAQADVRSTLDAIKSGRGQTQEKMKAVALDVLAGDKVDLRGVKISSKQFGYVLLGIVVVLILLIFMLPDAVAEILLRLAGVIGNGQP